MRMYRQYGYRLTYREIWRMADANVLNFAVGALLKLFKAKEVVQPSKPIAIPTHWWAWVLLTLLCALLGGFLLSSLSNEFFKMLR